MEQTTSEFFKNFDLWNSDRKSTSVVGNLESNFYLLDTDGHQGVQSPFQGFCQFPEGLTIIGIDVSFDFNHCNESFCSEHLIDYKDPTTGQLATLLEAATSCEQTITFDCFLSPIKVINKNKVKYVYFAICIYIF